MSITGNVKGSRRRSHAPTLLSVDEQGVTFRSYRDGQKVTLTPGLLVQKYSLNGTKVLANWYKSTNTDAKNAPRVNRAAPEEAGRGHHNTTRRAPPLPRRKDASSPEPPPLASLGGVCTQFTCFTSTKVQILTQQRKQARSLREHLKDPR